MSENAIDHTSARLARLRGFAEQDPENFSLLTDIFDCALALGEFETAQSYLSRALALQPGDVFLRHSQATLWIAQKRYAEAETLLSELISGGIDSGVVLFNLAYAKIRQQKHAEGRDILRPLLERQDAPPDTFAMLLRCLHHLREYDDAFQLIEQCQQANALDVAGAGVASLLYLEGGQIEQAKACAEAVLRSEPNHIEALVARGSIALSERDPEIAKPLLQRALSLNPNDGRVWSTSAFSHLLELNLDRALAEFKTAVALMPNHIGTWHGMAWCHLMKKDLAAAQQSFETAMAIDRNFGENHGGLAVVYALQGRRADAEASIERAQRLDPKNLSARYAEAVLSGEVADREAFTRLAERVLGGRSRVGGGSMADLLRKPPGRQ